MQKIYLITEKVSEIWTFSVAKNEETALALKKLPKHACKLADTLRHSWQCSDFLQFSQSSRTFQN